MSSTVYIGATRERMLRLAQEIKDAFADPNSGHTLTVHAEGNVGNDNWVDIEFSNDDMEGRTDLDPNVVLVEVDTDS